MLSPLDEVKAFIMSLNSYSLLEKEASHKPQSSSMCQQQETSHILNPSKAHQKTPAHFARCVRGILKK